MEILKDTIRYRGNDYPCVTIEFSDEEQDAYCIASDNAIAEAQRRLFDQRKTIDVFDEGFKHCKAIC